MNLSCNRLFDERTPAGEAIALAEELYKMGRISISERAAFRRALIDLAHQEGLQKLQEDLARPREL